MLIFILRNTELCVCWEAGRSLNVVCGQYSLARKPSLHAGLSLPVQVAGCGAFPGGLDKSVLYGRSCLFCCLTMLAIVSLVKAKYSQEDRDASFDITQVHFHVYVPCQMASCPWRRGYLWSEGDWSPVLMFYQNAYKFFYEV